MNMNEIDSPPDNEVARCVFFEADIEDAWSELVDDPDAEVPADVLCALQMQANLITEAMCQRGQEVIDELLHSIAQHCRAAPLISTQIADPYPQDESVAEIASLHA